jgi:Mlc titration factor MtfA (ptsG expression regulator)
MNDLWILFAIASVIFLSIAGWDFFRMARRRRLSALPWPTEWEAIAKQNVPLYGQLPPECQIQLHGLVQIFLAEKHFEGCGGLELTEEMKLTIAVQACILLLNRKIPIYPKLQTILIYPHAFVAKRVQAQGWGAFVEEEQALLGESWHQGLVILAWDQIGHGFRDVHNGHNVVLHEFAHQLDQEDGRSDGAPLMETGSQYISWARHLGQTYRELQEAVAKHHETFLDPYGATNPAEFFAVLTETFFEKPLALKNNIPTLYEELKNYYKLDPAGWSSS